MIFVFLYLTYFTQYDNLYDSPSMWLQTALPMCSAAQLCLTFCDPLDCSLPDSTVHEIFQTRILELVAISYSRGSC